VWEYEKAAASFQDAREQALKINDRWHIAEFYREVGEIHFASSNLLKLPPPCKKP